MPKPIPDGYHTVTPYLYVPDTAAAIAWYAKAFAAEELFRLPAPGGGVAHAEIKIGNSIVMLSDENPAWGTKSPKTLGGPSGGFCLYTTDSDALFAGAVAAGATVRQPMADMFWGDRSGSVIDPFGHVWMLSTHQEDVPPDEMAKRMAAFSAGQGG